MRTGIRSMKGRALKGPKKNDLVGKSTGDHQKNEVTRLTQWLCKHILFQWNTGVSETAGVLKFACFRPF